MNTMFLPFQPACSHAQPHKQQHEHTCLNHLPRLSHTTHREQTQQAAAQLSGRTAPVPPPQPGYLQQLVGSLEAAALSTKGTVLVVDAVLVCTEQNT